MQDPSSIVYTRLLSGTAKNPGIPDPLASLVVAQSQHESANYTSPVYLASNNAFGYKYSGSAYQRGNYEGYAKYDSLDDSAAEIVDYLYRRVADGSFPADLSTITSPDQYAQLLKDAGYYGDTEVNYSSGIATWFNQDVLVPLQNNPALGVLVLAGLFLAGYFITKKR